MNNQSGWSLALVHGIPGVIQNIDTLARQACPGVTVFNLLHEGIFLELAKAGRPTPSVINQLCQLFSAAERSGASVILVTGSTFSPGVDVARKLLSVPIVKIDEAMAEEAVKLGSKISLMATEAATVEPSSEILYAKAQERGRSIKIEARVVSKARALLREGKVAEHDALIVKKVREVAEVGGVDLIVFAQASMCSALAKAKEVTKVPICSSPELAVVRTRQVLMDLGWRPSV